MPLTMPGLSPSSSTVDHFRQNIYRPRLCLLLLILLLSPYHAPRPSPVTTSDATDAALQPGSPSCSTDWSVSVIDGLVVAAPVLPASSSLSLHAPSSTPPQSGSAAASSAPLVEASGSASAAPSHPTPVSASTAKHRPATFHDSQPTPGSLFKLPKLSWGLLFDRHVLPAVFPLHALWGIRFIGMAVEDGIVTSSLIGSKSRFYAFTLPLLQLAALALLALSIGTPPFIDAVLRWCTSKRLSLGLEGDAAAGGARTETTLLPLKLLVALELSTVLLSLLSSLLKIDDPALGFLPKAVRLPSPSHSPRIVELLPLPPRLAVVLRGTPASVSPSAGIGRRGRRPLIARAVDAGRQVAPPVATSDDGGDATLGRRNTAGAVTTESSAAAAPTLGEADERAPRRRVKAPRLHRQRVVVTSRWLSDTLVSLFDKLVGSVLYALVTLLLPTLSPTSLPPVLSLLSLRSELSSLTSLWTKARASVECLEFVRRRWGVELVESRETDAYSADAGTGKGKERGYKWMSSEEVTCSICFEVTRPDFAKCNAVEGDEVAKKARRRWRFCRLDCGHEMHDTCLVAWLTNQAFCPTCHEVLSFSPPPAVSEEAEQAAHS